MEIQPTDFGSAIPVDGYGPGFFRVGEIVYHGAILVTQGKVQPWAGLDDRAPLLALAGQVDVLFIGMGPEIGRVPADLVAALEARGVMVEALASPTAARIYNVTLSEGRRVACALIPV